MPEVTAAERIYGVVSILRVLDIPTHLRIATDTEHTDIDRFVRIGLEELLDLVGDLAARSQQF